MFSKIIRLFLYFTIVLSPIFLNLPKFLSNDDPLSVRMGDGVALLAFTILAMQFVLSARIRWIERPFGLDRIFRFHKLMAIVAVLLLAAHPPLLVIGEFGPSLLTNMKLPWPLLIGKPAFLILCAVALFSLFRAAWRIEYQSWRAIHNILVLLIFTAGAIHSLLIGPDLQAPHGYTRILWIILTAIAITFYLYHQVWQRSRLKRHAWTIMNVEQETPGVWTLTFQPPQGRSISAYQPGQFHFIRLFRGPGLSAQEHHFTISSSPANHQFLTSTIKESGDYTALIGRTQIGDRAAIEGPFGRFSYVNHHNPGRIIFIAGGIGITPLMSMLRHMRDTGEMAEVLLLYASHNENEIIFNDELYAMIEANAPRLSLVNILSKPGDGWHGERGRIDHEKIARLCGKLNGTETFYVCAPGAMINTVRTSLKHLNVKKNRVFFEKFSL